MSHTEYDIIPEVTLGALDRYLNHRIATGDFLRAVLSDNLFDAMARADLNNRRALHAICMYIYNELPCGCWGNEGKVDRWLAGEE